MNFFSFEVLDDINLLMRCIIAQGFHQTSAENLKYFKKRFLLQTGLYITCLRFILRQMMKGHHILTKITCNILCLLLCLPIF